MSNVLHLLVWGCGSWCSCICSYRQGWLLWWLYNVGLDCACCVQGYCWGKCWLQGCLNKERPAEGLGWGYMCWNRWSYSSCMEKNLYQYLVKLGSSGVAPLKMCMGNVMLTWYHRVFQGLTVSCVVVEVPPALRGCLLKRGVHWLRWWPRKNTLWRSPSAWRVKVCSCGDLMSRRVSVSCAAAEITWSFGVTDRLVWYLRLLK